MSYETRLDYSTCGSTQANIGWINTSYYYKVMQTKFVYLVFLLYWTLV